jgi:hypothetical protein
MSRSTTDSLAAPPARAIAAGCEAQPAIAGMPAGADSCPPRRRFFRAALCAPVVAVAAATNEAAAAPVADPEIEPAPSSSYRETPHIRTYYDLAAY